MSAISTSAGHRFPCYVRLFFWNQRRKYGAVLEPTRLWGRSPWVFMGVALLYGALGPYRIDLQVLLSGRDAPIRTHDPRVEDVADRILWLEDGKLRDRRSETHSRVRCPVCRMRVDEWTATVTAEHAGRRYVFCSTTCRRRFQDDPAAYARP